MNTPILLEEAWSRLIALARPLGTEDIPVDAAGGRYLAAPLVARRTQPARDLSAMDGFAVSGDGPWRIVGESRAGAMFAGALATGEAARISTGAAVPEGADAIVLQEDSALEGTVLSAHTAPDAGHIRRRGFDFAKDTVLLEPGVRLGPAQIALALAAGHAELPTARRPRITVIECGDELVADPRNCPDDRLPASNGAMVAGMVAGLCERVARSGPLADDRGVLARAFEAAAESDIIVTTAGASVGDHDHVQNTLVDWGARLEFWRVAIRPGKPLLVARRGEQLVLGLPGNPASAFVTAYLFLLPLLRAMQGAASPLPHALPLRLQGPLPAGQNRREFRRARLVDGEAEPLDERDSSALRTLAAADLLIDRPAFASPAKAGDMARCYWIGNDRMA